MLDEIHTLTDAWRLKTYGPFLTRTGQVVNVADKKQDAQGLTVYVGDNGVSYYPTGMVNSNGAPSPLDIPDLSVGRSANKRGGRVRSEARLLYHSKKLEEARRDLREYIRGAYPIDTEVSYTAGVTFRSGTLVQIRDTALVVKDEDTELLRTVQFHRLIGPRVILMEDDE